MKRSDIEIMAPVGSYESLAAAIQAGADAVYFGVGKLNMRAASAANFSLDDLGRIVATARRAGVSESRAGHYFAGKVTCTIKDADGYEMTFAETAAIAATPYTGSGTSSNGGSR